jgi:hypothetical protein
VLREHSGVGGAGWGVFRGGGTTPTGELLTKHTRKAMVRSEYWQCSTLTGRSSAIRLVRPI